MKITSINEFAKSKMQPKIVAKIQNCIAVEYGFRNFFIFQNDYEKLAADDFRKANLMNDYFTGTAIIGQKNKNTKRSTTDFSDPMHTGQVMASEEEKQEFSEDEEIDFVYDRKMDTAMINKLLDKIVPLTYIPGTVVKKVYLG